MEDRFLHQHSNLSIALPLFVLLVSIYSLTYSGTFITDDEHILASRTLSLAFDGYLNDNRVYGNSRVYDLSQNPPLHAAQGVNIEPGQAFIGAALARLSYVLDVGHIQAIFLLNIWVTASTAICVFCAVLLHGFPRLTALLCTLLFGLGTMAWPYSKTYFRDSLAMFFLTVAWLSAIGLLRKKSTGVVTWLSWFGVIAGLVLGTLTKNTVIVALPVLLPYIFLREFKNSSTIRWIHSKNKKPFFLTISVVLLAIVLWTLFFPSVGIFARFSPSYYLLVLKKFLITPHPLFLEAIAGPLISPGKSIMIYSPCLILSILGSIKKWQLTWPAWLYLFLLIICQALFFDWEWWGFINWGLRFVLPAIPPLIIASAPIVDIWLRTQKGRFGLIGIGILSLSVQLISVLPPMRQYYLDMLKTSSRLLETAGLWNPMHSPWMWHIKWILSGGSWDLAAVRAGVQSVPIILGFMIVVGAMVMGLLRTTKILLPGIGLLVTIVITAFMLLTYKSDPAYSPTRTDLELVQEMISQHILEDDIVLIKSYVTPAWFYWMNWGDTHYKWTSLPFYFPIPSLIEEYHRTQDPSVALDEITLSLFQELPGSYQRVWLVLPGDTPGVDLEIEANWLKALSTSSEEWVFTVNAMESRLYLFVLTHSSPY